MVGSSTPLNFICHLTPLVYLEKINGVSNAAFHFQNKVIKALEPDNVIAIMPLPCYGLQYELEYDRPSTRYLNGRYLRKGKVAKLILDYIDALRQIEHRSINIYYSLNIQSFIVLIISKYFQKTRNYVIVADYEDHKLKKGFVKKIIQYCINKVYKHATGVIVLNENIKIHPKTILINAILDENELLLSDELYEEKSILFSGTIGETFGINLMVSAMELLPDFTLYITGKLIGLSSNDILEMIKLSKSKNIYYLGNIPYPDYLKLLNRIECAVSLRDPNNYEHLYNFPSKIVEYLSYNKVVVSTIHYPALNEKIIISEYNVESLAKNILLSQKFEKKNLSLFVVNKYGIQSFRNQVLDFIGNKDLI